MAKIGHVDDQTGQQPLKQPTHLNHFIQTGIVFGSLPQRADFRFGARIKPTRAVGGDFYDVIPFGDDLVGIAVGDVSDHGVHSALFMAITVTLLRSEARRSVSPCEVLNNVNQQLLEMNDSNMFVTVLYGMLDTKNRQLHYTRAGHELPLVINSKGEFIPQPKELGMPLGLFDDPDIDEQSVTMGVGDTLLLYTDGVTDAENEHGEQFGMQRLQDALVKIHRAPDASLSQLLLTEIQEFCGDAPQYDDITLFTLQAGS